MEKYKEKIINFLKQPILYVVIFCVLIQILTYKTIPNYIMTSDSYTYTEEYNTSIIKGQVDALRTPVYPYLAKIIGKIGGQERIYENIVIFQKLLFIVTILLFYDCLKKITKNNIITSILTILFGICPFITFWNIMILTETLALFEITLLSWITIQYLNKPNKILASMMRYCGIRNDYDKTVLYLSVSHLPIILDFKIFLS